ncbi:MAG: PSD1 domain-containing protein [Armatimonadetes bacterium]|nr:PSD1 domain-containing protein [Armatimonadota bacterium]
MAAGGGAQEKNPAPDYTRDILPIFKTHCFSCHSGDSARADLRLDTKAGIEKGGASGPLVKPGDPKASLLYRRITSDVDGAVMPMGFAPLSKEKIDAIAAWIAAGAKLTGSGAASKHWAYEKPVKTKPRVIPHDWWAYYPIDALTQEVQLKHGVRHSPWADKTTLIRRVTFDLTGLPPTADEVQNFLNDNSRSAYEKVIDRLLASPAYGERMAAWWLDLARYADSNGYEKDANRTMWPYRDWVINAFNKDMPFDQFTVEQIAGDLLPAATRDQIVATGFHRNTMINEEGGVDQGEQRWLTLVDRVSTTGTVWLATTIGCAQCHDHKYDPVTNDDFYRMLAFWESAEEPTLDLAPQVVKDLRAQLAAATGERDKTKEKTPERDAAQKRVDDIYKTLVAYPDYGTTLVMKEKVWETPKTNVRIKGTYLAVGKPVTAETPGFLPPRPKPTPVNRLGLARWLVSKDNPLTARVTVNRIWEQAFGVGLVKTSDDFGTQGERPEQQRLLDWLAVTFMEEGWSFKKLWKWIVGSGTYQQSSVCSTELREKDPENRLLARGPRFRLSAEAIRDNALAVSGLLSRKVGGPSVMPDQPPGVWKTPYSGEAWNTSQGEDRYRRSVYTWWKRSSTYPAFMTFDATSRETCTAKRVRTNTPLQALVLLNDDQMLAAAVRLGQVMKQKGIERGFVQVLARQPNSAETRALVKVYQDAMARYLAKPEQATKFLGREKGSSADPVDAAWAVTAQVLLNLDETITKE